MTTILLLSTVRTYILITQKKTGHGLRGTGIRD